MEIERLRSDGLILMEAISGSRAYGLSTPESDTDIKGVFILPKQEFYGLDPIRQVSNESSDIVFYEWRRFMEFCLVNNPNILELLATPEDCLITQHPLLADIDPTRILSKKCKDTFGRFAVSQIKKARGLKKKIVNPVAKERKTILNFCYIAHKNGSIPLLAFLEKEGLRQEDCGLVNIPHMQNVFGLYRGDARGNLSFRGIMQKESSTRVALSSIPKGTPQAALMYFNENGYSAYCREYADYWAWVEKRNDTRFESTQKHGKQYDAKNMMHTFRLLEMAIEIGRNQTIKVRRPDRDFLLRIKRGEFEYEELLAKADEKQAELEDVFASTDLPEEPDRGYIEDLAVSVRDRVYAEMGVYSL